MLLLIIVIFAVNQDKLMLKWNIIYCFGAWATELALGSKPNTGFIGPVHLAACSRHTAVSSSVVGVLGRTVKEQGLSQCRRGCWVTSTGPSSPR